MPARWWGRAFGPAIAAILLAGSTATVTGGLGVGDGAGERDTVRWELVGRATDGSVVLRVPLSGGRFTLEYRNSLYGSPAAEHFAVTDEGQLALAGLSASDAAVLQEYYGATDRPRRATAGLWAGWWHAPASQPVELPSLTVLASRHGERTLVAGPATRIALWEAVDDGRPSITLEARPAG